MKRRTQLRLMKGPRQLHQRETLREATIHTHNEEELQRENAYLEGLFESAQEAIAMTDRDYVVLRVNREFTRLFGYTQEEAAGRPIDDLVAPEGLLRKEAEAITNRVGKGESVAFEGLRRHKDGRLVDVSAFVSPIVINNEQVAIYGIYHDTTERKRAEEALQRAHDEMEGHVRERTTELVRINEELQTEITERKYAEEINRTLFSISNAVNTTRNLDELYRSIHQSLGRVIDTTNFFIALYNKEQDIVAFPYHVDEMDSVGDYDKHDMSHTSTSGSLTAEVIKTGKPLFMKKKERLEWIKRLNKRITGTPAEAWLGVPLKIKNEVIGVMAIQSYADPHRFSRKDLDILLSVCDQVALAIERKQAEEALRESEEINRTLFSISNAVNTTRNLDELYRSIHQSLGRVIDATNFFIGLYNKEKDSLSIVYDVGEKSDSRLEFFDISSPDSSSHIAVVIKTGKPVLHTKEDFMEYLSTRGLKPMMDLSLIWLGVPLKIKGEIIGAMVVHSYTNPTLYSQRDVDILLSVSDQVALAIERKQAEEAVTEHKEALTRSFFGTAEALSKVIEDRDPYTSGHSAGVAQIAVDIAHEMGLPGEEITGIYIASILHDIGKMAVPVEILVKPGRLAELEMSLIRRHAQTGYEIIKGIGFPWPVAQTTLQHHERMNGSGYPQGLKGEEIILEARILAVADVVDAMTHHRPYRPALSLDETMEELTNGRGSIYDPLVVDTCIRVLERGLSPSTSSYAMSSTSPHMRRV